MIWTDIIALPATLMILTSGNPLLPECKTDRAPVIEVLPRQSKLKVFNHKSRNLLKQKEIGTRSPYSHHTETRVGGLMAGNLQTETRMSFGGLSIEELNLRCLWFDQVTVNLNLDPEIYIASEYRPGSCEYNAILEHEKKHLRVDQEIVNEYAQRIGSTLSALLRYRGNETGWLKGPQIAATQDRMQQSVQAALDNVMSALENDRKARQQNIDSLEEYERVSAQCKGFGRP